MIGLFIAYEWIGIGIELSIGLGLVLLFGGLTISSVGLSVLAESSALLSNIAFSCGLITISILVFGLCMVVGALAATVLLFLSI